MVRHSYCLFVKEELYPWYEQLSAAVSADSFAWNYSAVLCFVWERLAVPISLDLCLCFGAHMVSLFLRFCYFEELDASFGAVPLDFWLVWLFVSTVCGYSQTRGSVLVLRLMLVSQYAWLRVVWMRHYEWRPFLCELLGKKKQPRGLCLFDLTQRSF